MTAASTTHMTKMGEICAARSKVDSMLGETDDKVEDIGVANRAPFDRNAMIQLRQARGRWSDDAAPDAAIDEVTEIVIEEPDEPVEFVVLDLPSFDLRESVAVRDRAAYEDRKLRIDRMARRADVLWARLEDEAQADEIDAVDEPVEPPISIDLRDESVTVIELADEESSFSPPAGEMHDVITAIRRLSALRDEGLITIPEFDERMTDLLAQV